MARIGSGSNNYDLMACHLMPVGYDLRAFLHGSRVTLAEMSPKQASYPITICL